MAKGFKSGGRKKGSLNKLNSANREKIQEFLDDYWSKYKEWFDEAGSSDPAKGVQNYHELLEYVTPKLQRMELTGAEGEELQVSINIHLPGESDAKR